MSVVEKSNVVITGTVIGAVISYVYNPLFIAPIIGTEGIAVVGTFLYLINLFSFPQFPVTTTLMKYIADYFATNSHAKTSTVVVKSLKKLTIYGFWMSVILSLFAFPITQYLKLNTSWVVITAILVTYISLLQTVGQAALHALLRFRQFSILLIVDPVFRLLVGVGFVWMGYHLVGVLLAYVIGHLAALILGLWYLKDVITAKDKAMVDHREMYTYSVPVWAYAAFLGFAMSIDGLIAKHYFSDADSGIYIAAATLAKLMYIIVLPISNVCFAYTSNSHAAGKTTLPHLISSMAYTSLTCLTALAFCFFIPSQMIDLTYGPLFTQAGFLLPFAALSAVPLAFMLIYSNYCLARGANRFVTGLWIGGAIHLALLVYFHDSLLDIIIANGLGGLIELCLSLVFSASQLTKTRSSK